jgi:SAM-dependent methyltransferase
MRSTHYSSYRDWKNWSHTTFGFCSTEFAVYFSAELRLSGVENVRGKRVLEVGFGNGEFARWARDSGADYHGTELIDGLVACGVAQGFNAYHGRQPLDGLLDQQSVDLIVSFDVFEHCELTELRATLQSGFNALRPTGRLIARVPSGDSPFSRSIQHGDMTHRITIGSSMIHQLANEVGFSVESVREPAFPLWGLGCWVFLRRAIVAILRVSAFAVIKRVFMGGGRPVLTPNMVFVLVKP